MWKLIALLGALGVVENEGPRKVPNWVVRFLFWGLSEIYERKAPVSRGVNGSLIDDDFYDKH